MRRITLALVIALAGMSGGASALAAGVPQWTVSVVSRPTNFAPASEGVSYRILVTNTGSAASSGQPITITDELPVGLSAVPGATAEDELGVHNNSPGAKFSKSCVQGSCSYSGVVAPDDSLIITIPVRVAAAPPASCPVPAGAVSCVTNVVRVSGGGAVSAVSEAATTISSSPAVFGISPGGATTALSSSQAGAHADLTTSLAFNTVNKEGSLAGAFKDTIDDLPPGFGLDLPDTPACASAAFLQGECAIGTQVGVTTVTVIGAVSGPQLEPVYNLEPNPGEAAKIGFAFGGKFFYEGDISVRPGDYGGRATFFNATQGITEVNNVSLTIWGVPADPVHDSLRWKPGPPGSVISGGSFGTSSDATPAPYFTNATTCQSTPLEATISANSWEDPESFSHAPMQFGPLVGCDRLAMSPSLIAEPTTSEASSATGLNVTTSIVQTYNNATGLAASTLKRAVVALPEGMTVNPSAGAGLAACSPQQFAEETSEAAQGSGCPNESKLGTVKIQTPLLREEATGSVFLAQPYNNPFNSLLALYIVARIPNRGIIVKVAGEVSADPVTGRLVTTFTDLPPLPFSTFKFAFRQGATSPLVTPPACGEFTVGAEMTPWAIPDTTQDIFAPPFSITSGFDGRPCPTNGELPFAPQVLAGTQGASAGAYSPMYIRLIRGDGEQEVTRFSAQLPPGLTANLSGVPFCSDADIELSKTKSGAAEETEPSCPAASMIGHTLVGAGVGSVLAYAPGRVYMAGPYHGAPFSIVAITSAKVGPFDLGTVVVRVALKIDPLTAVVTVDSAGSDPIPHIIKGIVVHVRDIRVYIDRPNFSLNPTNCQPETFATTIDGSGANFVSSTDDVPVTVDAGFQVVNCQALHFAPTFTATASGKPSRVNGESLTVHLTYPKAPQGTQANIRSVKVDLPRQLPSRLTTLQKACRDTVFNANPAACPTASTVGQAKAVTPILPVPLAGPAYFVSHGGAKFPELVLVLQGYGVRVDLHGETLIKNGITSSTFHTVPDQPVTSFELTLPQGPNSALAAFGNPCKPTRKAIVRKTTLQRHNGHTKRVVKKVAETVATKLQMPTIFTAQNGATLKQNTPITVTQCPTPKHQKAKH